MCYYQRGQQKAAAIHSWLDETLAKMAKRAIDQLEKRVDILEKYLRVVKDETKMSCFSLENKLSELLKEQSSP